MPRTQRLQQLRFFLPRGLYMGALDVTVTPNALGDRGNLHGKRMILRTQLAKQLIDSGLVGSNELTLEAPIGVVAEGIEGRAT